MSTKGGIHWEVASRDIEGIRTELTCTQESINVTSNEGLRINLSTGERRAMSGYPQLTFKTDIKLKVKVGTPWLDKPLELMKHTPEVSYKQRSTAMRRDSDDQ